MPETRPSVQNMYMYVYIYIYINSYTLFVKILSRLSMLAHEKAVLFCDKVKIDFTNRIYSQLNLKIKQIRTILEIPSAVLMKSLEKHVSIASLISYTFLFKDNITHLSISSNILSRARMYLHILMRTHAHDTVLNER